ncbi:MAG: phosphoenolpyruvate carboxykinase (ATP), partial [Atopobiaceae bacterium]|nr:phosphoenolpyruvate carboxykinase (ATP) [Atopobiaceae bacterium]
MPIQDQRGTSVRPIRSHGQRSIQDQLAACGLADCRGAVMVDAAPATLIEKAIDLHEGILTSKGALAVETGRYTGRSPEDRFIVDTPDVHDEIAWGPVNKPFTKKNYDYIKQEVV